MSKSKAIFIYHFNSEITNYDKELFSILSKTKYSDEGYGFKDIKIEKKLISGVLINRMPTYIYEYEVSSNEFVKKAIFLFHEISFSIDCINNIIQVFGSYKYVSQLRMVLNKILSFNHNIYPLELTPYKLYNIIKSQKINFLVEELAIEKFDYNGIVGRFSGQVIKQKDADKLINEYQNDVIKILLKININKNENFQLFIGSNSSVRIISEAEDFDYYFSFLKQLIF